MKKALFSLSLASILLGVEVPRWFSSPSLNSDSFYGFGVASDIKQAKENAILDLTSSIHSSVKVVFEREITRNNSEITSKSSQKSSIESEVVNLVNIEPKNVECKEGKCYVEVELKKEDLKNQLKQKLQTMSKEIKDLSSPFDYQYKKSVLYPKISSQYAIYSALGGLGCTLPELGEKPSFQLVFKYEDGVSKGFKGVFEKTIQDYITRFGTISSGAKWVIQIVMTKEGKEVTLEVSVSEGGKTIHGTSISDTQKSNVSSSFFAKRLGVQAYKKMQKWGKN